jgi:hypothetical protein
MEWQSDNSVDWREQRIQSVQVADGLVERLTQQQGKQQQQHEWQSVNNACQCETLMHHC